MKRITTLVAAACMCAATWAQATVPATLAFASQDDFDQWTVIDNNASTSANTWGYSSGNNEALYPQDKKVAADDWLISPAVTLEAGKTYDINYYIVQRSTFSSDKQKYAITVGNAATISGQSTVLAKNESFQSKLYSKQTCQFTPAESGTYYLGVHLYSGSYMGDCGFQKFEISEGAAPVVKEYNIPYSETFDTSASLDDFTTFNNDGTRTWTYYSSSKCAQFWGGTSADAWLITPGINMKSGKTYKMTFNAGLESAVSSNNYKNLSVTIGQGVTANAQGTKLWEEQIKSALMEGKECYFTVPEDGKYNVGFRVLGQSSSYAVFVDNISIVESVSIPAAATNLTVTPADHGALSATVSWVNPAVDKAGNTLAAISKVDVKRGEYIIATYDAPEVGATMSMQDEFPEAGVYTYSVVAYSGETAGDAATVTSPWIGVDTPKAVTDVVLADGDGSPYLTWEAPVEGVNGGYINADALTYRVVRNPGSEEVATGLTATSFLDTDELSLSNYSYVVYASCGDLESEGAVSNSMIFGGALELPYVAVMNDADHMALWTLVDANGDGKGWEYKNGELQYTSMKNADDYAFTPPFFTKAGTMKLTYRVKGYSYRYSDAYEVVLTNTTAVGGQGMTRADAYSEVIETVGQNALQSSMYVTREVEFHIPSTGVYYLGFHNVSTDSWGLYVGGTSVEVIELDPSTGIGDVTAGKTVSSVRYVNAAGQQSATPFAGMNIVVTTFTDGSTQAVKVIK